MCQKEVNRKKETKFNLKDWQDGGISSFEQTCFADYWSNDDESSTMMNILPSISSSSGTPIIDPYDFGHRMALGKCLIESSSSGSKSIWGDAYCEKHWYWGYLAQLDWQWRTGRLLSPSSCETTTDTTDTTDITFSITTNSNEALPTTKISTESWFGYMNLNFSVAAYMGAAKAQLVPSVKFLDTSRNNDENVEEDPGFQICVDLWYSFWTGPHAQYLASMKNTATSKAEGDDATKTNQEALITLYRELWETHTSIIQAGLKYAKKEEGLLPDLERQFGLGWCHQPIGCHGIHTLVLGGPHDAWSRLPTFSCLSRCIESGGFEATQTG